MRGKYEVGDEVSWVSVDTPKTGQIVSLLPAGTKPGHWIERLKKLHNAKSASALTVVK